MENIKLLQELKEFIAPLGKEEYAQLEKNIIEEGCRDALSVWENKDNELILIDGHNRFKICNKHNVPYEIKKFHFKNIEDVKNWMLQNQLGRRNLNPDQLSYYRGLKYLRFRKEKGGYTSVLSKGQIEPTTSEILSKEFKVSESTIKRDSKYAEAIDLVGKTNSKLKIKILSGEVKIKKSDLQVLLKDKDMQDFIIVNEADLHHKINIVKEDLLSKVEHELELLERKQNEEKIKKLDVSEAIVNRVEPLFLEQEDRLKKIKGRILSAINDAINNKDPKAIEILKSLIDKLEYEIMSLSD